MPAKHSFNCIFNSILIGERENPPKVVVMLKIKPENKKKFKTAGH
jgi:hypothetical protein